MDKETNDALRARIPFISPPDALLVTRGIYILGSEVVHKILSRVKSFKDFNPDNDPWEKHDFGSFNYNGKKILWKIDDCQGYEGYNLVLTVMLAKGLSLKKWVKVCG